MHCPLCQAPLLDDAQFCSSCGAGKAAHAAAKKPGRSTCAVIAGVAAVAGILFILVIVAIAIPSMYSSPSRSKQKRTMGDMKTLAVAIETFNTDNNHYPTGDSLDKLCKQLTPDYLAICIRKDGWSSKEHPQEFRYLAWGYSEDCPATNSLCGPQHYVIVSAGKDGIFQQNDPRNYPPGDTTSFNSDIVLSDGQFIRAPTGKQSNGPAN